MWEFSCSLFMYKISLNNGGTLCSEIVPFCLYIIDLFNDTCNSYARQCQTKGWLENNEIEIRHGRKQTWPNLTLSSITRLSPVRWSWNFLYFPLIVRVTFHMFLCYKKMVIVLLSTVYDGITVVICTSNDISVLQVKSVFIQFNAWIVNFLEALFYHFSLAFVYCIYDKMATD